MMTVYLARHGQTEENLARIFQGHLPGRLTAEGQEQARELGRLLRGVELDVVVSSDLQRCVDTVRLALDDRVLPWERSPLLREIDWGSWTGLPIASVDLEHFPADVETKAMLYERAGRVLADLRARYADRRVLVVAHGLFNRSLQAQIEGVPLEQLRSVPRMANAELRTFRID